MIAQVALDLPNIETLDYSYNPANTNNSTKTDIIGHWVIVKVKNKKKCRSHCRRKKIFTCQTG